jgi:hypothetical protein
MGDFSQIRHDWRKMLAGTNIENFYDRVKKSKKKPERPHKPKTHRDVRFFGAWVGIKVQDEW